MLLLKNNEDLNESEKSDWQDLFRNSTVLEFADDFKEELRKIYESDLTVKSGLRKMKKWLSHAQMFFPSIANTLEKHLPDIANYFLNKTTSGVTEGINTRIKLILRQSYGFSNFKSMREKLLAKLMTSNTGEPIWRRLRWRRSLIGWRVWGRVRVRLYLFLVGIRD